MSLDSKQLCIDLMACNTEVEVIEVLDSAGLWEDGDAWRYFGDDDGNFDTIGNQQSRPEASLVEKIINCVDARLILACLLAGLDPEGPDAPSSIREAVARFIEHAKNPDSADAGRVKDWVNEKRTGEGRLITLAASGLKTPDNATYSIADAGEGQTPLRMPDTFLSLHKANKLRIPFVQGKFNMGGTGALQFCGKNNLQLVVTRRHPDLVKDSTEPTDSHWGFTIVRRENPSGGRRTSTYTYLAPINKETAPHKGLVLSFAAKTMPIFPDGKNPHGREAAWGSLVKMFEYESSGFKSNIISAGGGLLRRLDFLIAESGLPVRLYECRDFAGHAGSFETNLTGLAVRLEDDRVNSLEDVPSSAKLSVHGEPMGVTIYAFKKGKAKTYRRSEGIAFVVNGQTHGYISTEFFKRRSVSMSYLADSLLVVVDCSEISGRAREDLFMNSRDRLREGELKKDIERLLEDMLRNDEGLRRLKERRRQEEIAERLGDSKPLEEVLQSILRNSPALSTLFIAGQRLSNPFKTKTVAQEERKYEGKRFPTIFKFRNVEYGKKLTRECHENLRARISFETDAENDYFMRDLDQGTFELLRESGGEWEATADFVLNLHEGVATLTLPLPEGTRDGDELHFRAVTTDESRIEPFINEFDLRVKPATKPRPPGSPTTPRKPPSPKQGTDREQESYLALPTIIEVEEENWGEYEPPFDKNTALRIRHAGRSEGADASDAYDFYVNVDNLYLKTEQKGSSTPPQFLNSRFIYGLVLIGLGLLQDERTLKKIVQAAEDEEEEAQTEANIEDIVERVARSIAPVLLPMIDALGGLEVESD